MRIAVIAGELSGDQLGGQLIEELKALKPDAEFFGIGGDRMARAGCECWHSIDVLSVMGLAVIPHIPRLLKLRKQLIQRLLADPPDVFIGIDAPDFNLAIAKVLKKHGIKTVHYVSPSIWAWKPWRRKGICQATNLVMCLLPFEPALYHQVSHSAVFVGHPMARAIPMDIDKFKAKENLNVSTEVPVLALLPGSRKLEVKKLLPVMLDVVEKTQAKNEQPMTVLLPLARKTLEPLLDVHQPKLKDLGVKVLSSQAADVLAAADWAICASGTVTLEAMLYHVPMVVIYKLSAISYWIVKRMVKTPYVALPNIIAGEEVVKELIQDQANVENISAELDVIMGDTAHALRAKFSELHTVLQVAPDKSAAREVLKLLEDSAKFTSVRA